jgi:hypothetical protein
MNDRPLRLEYLKPQDIRVQGRLREKDRGLRELAESMERHSLLLPKTCRQRRERGGAAPALTYSENLPAKPLRVFSGRDFRRVVRPGRPLLAPAFVYRIGREGYRFKPNDGLRDRRRV